MQDLAGRVALIAGAGGGIGRALAWRLAEARMRLGLVDRHGGEVTFDQVSNRCSGLSGGVNDLGLRFGGPACSLWGHRCGNRVDRQR